MPRRLARCESCLRHYVVDSMSSESSMITDTTAVKECIKTSLLTGEPSPKVLTKKTRVTSSNSFSFYYDSTIRKEFQSENLPFHFENSKTVEAINEGGNTVTGNIKLEKILELKESNGCGRHRHYCPKCQKMGYGSRPTPGNSNISHTELDDKRMTEKKHQKVDLTIDNTGEQQLREEADFCSDQFDETPAQLHRIHLISSPVRRTKPTTEKTTRQFGNILLSGCPPKSSTMLKKRKTPPTTDPYSETSNGTLAGNNIAIAACKDMTTSTDTTFKCKTIHDFFSQGNYCPHQTNSDDFISTAPKDDSPSTTFCHENSPRNSSASGTNVSVKNECKYSPTDFIDLTTNSHGNGDTGIICNKKCHDDDGNNIEFEIICSNRTSERYVSYKEALTKQDCIEIEDCDDDEHDQPIEFLLSRKIIESSSGAKYSSESSNPGKSDVSQLSETKSHAQEMFLSRTTSDITTEGNMHTFLEPSDTVDNAIWDCHLDSCGQRILKSPQSLLAHGSSQLDPIELEDDHSLRDTNESTERCSPLNSTLFDKTLPFTIAQHKENITETMLVEFQTMLENEQNNHTSNLNLESCFICGMPLGHITSGWNGRLRHLKTCAKKNGVCARDMRSWSNPTTTENTTSLKHHNEKQEGSNFTSSTVRSSSSTKILNPYQKLQDTPSTVSSIKTETPSIPSVNSVLMAAAKRSATIAKINHEALSRKTKEAPAPRSTSTYSNRRSGRFGYNNSKNQSVVRCPTYKMIPQSDFVCDGFQYASENVSNQYFLTHFHSDHYGGINKSWRFGTIYCSKPTANLVHQQLGVDWAYLHPLPMHVPTVLESKGKPVIVTVLNANHCPGAVMFLFEIGKRVILHVGDFRWNTDIMMSQPPLRPFMNGKRQIDDLFLDTTYCDAKYDLPTQDQCIQEAVNTALKELESAKSLGIRLLMLFGAYTIGKEAIYISVAEKLSMKVYVDRWRYRVLTALEWPREKYDVLTTNPDETILWVVPLGHINMKRLPAYLSLNKAKKKCSTTMNSGCIRDFDKVVGFRPTGWSHTASSSKSFKGTTAFKRNDGLNSTTKIKSPSISLTTNTRGPITIHSVPYSEHSSFPELVECIYLLKPKRIIPTVSVSKSQQQIDLLIRFVRKKEDDNVVTHF